MPTTHVRILMVYLAQGADRNLQREMRETVIHFIGCKANYVLINESQQTFQVHQLSSWEKPTLYKKKLTL